MPNATCSVEGCEMPIRARSWCVNHYNQWRRAGGVVRVPGRPCSVEGCHAPVKGRQLCNYHYGLWRRLGPDRARCAVEGCEAAAYVRGWCAMHYERWRTFGDPDTASKFPPEDGTRTCRKCGERKPLDAFGPARTGRGGINSRCRRCHNEASSAWGRANPLRVAARARRWRVEHPERTAELAAAYRRSHQDQYNENSRRRYALLAGATVEKVDPSAIFERDRWICQLCGKRVVRGQQSLDHILPLSKGGTHASANVQLAHRSCNSRKRDRVFGTGEQLRLLG